MTVTAEPLVSVVTPFYNTELYLAECIESVLNQTYRNFEYVLIDNCSTDRSLEIAQRYAALDPRIRLVRNTTFLTQTQNLNRGAAEILPESEYTKIVQADDFLFPTCLSRMVAVARANPSIGVVGAYTILGWKDRGDVYLAGLRYPSPFTPGREVARLFLLQSVYLTGAPTATLVRSDLVRSRRPFYNEVSPVEDVDVMFDLFKISDFGFVHEVLTYTRRENESIVSAMRVFNLWQLTEIVAIRKYGRDFLDPAEYARRRRELERRYYLMLGENVWRFRPKRFWEMHRQGLRWTGQDLEPGRLILYSLLALLERLLNPLNLLRDVGRVTRRRLGRNR